MFHKPSREVYANLLDRYLLQRTIAENHIGRHAVKGLMIRQYDLVGCERDLKLIFEGIGMPYPHESVRILWLLAQGFFRPLLLAINMHQREMVKTLIRSFETATGDDM